MNYHTDTTALTRSQLIEFIKSPEVYHGMFIAGTVPHKAPSKQMDIGTVAHAILLERKPIEDVVLALPDSCLKSNGAINPTARDRFSEDNPDRIILKAEEYDNVKAICEAVEKSPLAPVLKVAASCEETIEAEVHGRLCKCKTDILGHVEDHVSAVDLKIGKLDVFRNNARRLRYWMQDAHYSKVIEAHHGKPCVFRFCMIESQPPFRVRWWWYDQPSRETARKHHQEQVERLLKCEAAGVYEDDHDPILVLSPWEVGDKMEEFDG